MDIKEKPVKSVFYGLPSSESFKLIVGMTGLPTALRASGDPLWGEPKIIALTD